jgi:UDP-N-acetylmuramate dehydrogenase
MKFNLQHNVPLHSYTSWRVGGNATYFLDPENINQIQECFSHIPKNAAVYWLGYGSNVLIRDQGISGYVVSTRKGLQEIKNIEPYRVRVEAGVSCAKFARFAARLGYAGGEFLAGIPGSIGGALAMNAGCWGGETWNLVDTVETIDREGRIRFRQANEFQVGYREVKCFPNEWFLAGHFSFLPGEKEASLAKIKELLDKRAASQPTGEPSCGSVFRNPPNHFAAQLIESSNLKGYKIGQAQVSIKHANFIVNLGEAKASDIENLIAHVAETVMKTHGIQLIKEVKILGE